MSQLAIVHHTAHGHTEFSTRHVQAGVLEVDGIAAHAVRAEEIARPPDELVGCDGFVVGSPTCLGGVSAAFKGQAGQPAPARAFAAGDVETARLVGRHVARSLQRVGVSA